MTVIDQTAVLTPKVLARRLGTLKGVRRELARVYADARCGVISPGDAGRFAFVLTSLRAALEAETLENRVQALERHIDGTVIASETPSP